MCLKVHIIWEASIIAQQLHQNDSIQEEECNKKGATVIGYNNNSLSLPSNQKVEFV